MRSEPEPEWTAHERGLMVALGVVRAGECQSCGHPLDESTDPEHEGRYKVSPPTRCHACTALGIKHGDYTEAPQPEALRFTSRLGG